MPPEEPQLLTVKEAARRVNREHGGYSERTIWRWKEAGMPTVKVDGIVYVHVEVLLAWWRERMDADPAHQKKLATRRAGDLRTGGCQTPQ